jgi:hypothetical protein
VLAVPTLLLHSTKFTTDANAALNLQDVAGRRASLVLALLSFTCFTGTKVQVLTLNVYIYVCRTSLGERRHAVTHVARIRSLNSYSRRTKPICTNCLN